MSLTEVSIGHITKKLYISKLKAYLGMFSSLVMSQFLAMLFSLGSNGGGSYSSSTIIVNYRSYSGDIIIVFAMIWVFTMAILMTAKANRDDHFAFVTNRLTTHLSNFYILITASIAGGVTATLSSFLVKILFFYFWHEDHFIQTVQHPQQVLIGLIATVFYLLLIAASGYFIGLVVQLNKLNIILIPALIIGSAILGVRSQGNNNILMAVISFFSQETMLIVFVIKVLISVLLLFTGSILISRRMEVGQ